MALALAVGAIVFRWLIKTFTRVFSGHADYSAAGHTPDLHVPWLGAWFVLVAPVLGGVLYGLLVAGSRGRRVVTGCRR